MKPIRFVGSARDDLATFPKSVRARTGHELFMLQVGRDPDNWKPMKGLGAGACEIRVRDETGAYRVILAKQRYRIARELAEGVNHG